MSGSSRKGCAGRATRTSPRRQRSLGGENDSPSRNLSRFLDTLADELSLGLDVRQIWRNDRFGRGGDHTEFLNAGFPAVRFSVAVENYNWQHQDLRTENGIVYGDTIDRMDFPYLRRVTQLNVAALAALARAPMPPAPTVEGAVSTDTTLMWQPVPGASDYIVRWRRTDAANWSSSLRIRDPIVIATCRVPTDETCTRSIGERCSDAPRHPRRRLGVRRLLGGGGRVGEPGRIRGAGRRVPALRAAPAGAA